MPLMRLGLEIAPYNLLPDNAREEPLEKLLEFFNENEASGLTISAVVSSATSHLIHSAAPSPDLQGRFIMDINTPTSTQMEDFVSCCTQPTPRPSEDLESILSSPSRQLQNQLLESTYLDVEKLIKTGHDVN
jgi:hypothetical protein